MAGAGRGVPGWMVSPGDSRPGMVGFVTVRLDAACEHEETSRVMSDIIEPPPRTIHDATFKTVFGDPRHAAAELKAVLPARVSRHIDWDTLEAAHASLVGTRFKQHHGDLIFHAGLNDGREAMVWLMFEHQSTVDMWMPLRVLELSQVFWHRWRERNAGVRLLPAIVPVVVYQGPAPWSAATSLGELMDLSEQAVRDFDGLGVSCRFVLDDLSTVSDEELSGREMEPYPRLGLVALKYGSDPTLLEALWRYRADIRALLATEHGLEQWVGLVDYTWNINPHVDRETYIEFLRPIMGQEDETTMMTIADKLRAEGRDDGVREGRNEGLREGQSQLVLELLAGRFGSLPRETEERVAKAEMDELKRWAMRLLDAHSLDEVFDPA